MNEVDDIEWIDLWIKAVNIIIGNISNLYRWKSYYMEVCVTHKWSVTQAKLNELLYKVGFLKLHVYFGRW